MSSGPRGPMFDYSSFRHYARLLHVVNVVTVRTALTSMVMYVTYVGELCYIRQIVKKERSINKSVQKDAWM